MGDISPLKDENTHVIMRTFEEKETERKKQTTKRRSTDGLTAAGYNLFESLRKLRMEIAREENMPPYIIFSDKTLIDMCAKMPENDQQMLNVSGVGASKLEKYGERFLGAIGEFRGANPDAVVSMPVEEGTEALREDPTDTKKKKKNKQEFYLTEADAEDFVYQDLYYITELTDELNRICSVKEVKKLKRANVSEYLMSEGLIYKCETDAGVVKLPTEKGLEYGIQIIEKVSQAGVAYKLLKYPPRVQKMVVDYLTRQLSSDTD
jgi:ATP-dependent DNA helicase RecQ